MTAATKYRELAESLFTDLRRERPGTVRMSAHVCGRRTAALQVVTEYAAEHGFDVLVLGRHGEAGGGEHGLAR